MNRRLILILVVVLLSGCEEGRTPLTPFQCRTVGVDVQDDDTITGTAVEIRGVDTQMEVRKYCRRPFDPNIQGCAYPVNDSEYVIIYWQNNNAKVIIEHEYCHVDYETKEHT